MAGLTNKIRFEVLRRDDFTCRYCGACSPETILAVDHVVPIALGGDETPTNLVAACRECNNGKSATPLDAPFVDDVDEKAVVVARFFALALESWADEREHLKAGVDEFDKYWLAWHCTADGSPIPRDADWAETVERWLAVGVTAVQLANLMPATMHRRFGSNDVRWERYCEAVGKHIRTITSEALRRGE